MEKREMTGHDFNKITEMIEEKREELRNLIGEVDFSKIKFSNLNKEELEIAKFIIEKNEQLKSLTLVDDDQCVKIDDQLKIEVYYAEDDIEVMDIKLVTHNPSLIGDIKEISINSKIGSSILGKKYDSEIYCELNNNKTLIKILEKNVDNNN